MSHWLKSHAESEWPDLSICQTEDACHVTDMESHPSEEVIEKMCSDQFFTKHKYKYVSAITERDDEDDVHSFCRTAGNTEAYLKYLKIRSDYNWIANYQDPEEVEVEQRSNSGDHSSNQGTIEGFESKRSHTEICQAGSVSRTPHEATYSQVTKIKKRVVEYSNAVFSFDQDDSWDENIEYLV